MLDKEKAILDVFGKLIPSLSEMEKEKLLAFGEGMAFKAEQQNREIRQSVEKATRAAG